MSDNLFERLTDLSIGTGSRTPMAAIDHIKELEAKLDKVEALLNLTLDTDDLGIWLVDEAPEGTQQMGHISWKQIARGVQQSLLQEKFMIAPVEMNNPEQLLKDLLNSDSFDELVAYRLKMSLETCLESLRKKDAMFDYVDTLLYARSLVTVLEWFTIDDYKDTLVMLDLYSLKLDEAP